MAGISSALDHLLCSICTEVFTDPVILSCQHTYCKECIHKCLSAGLQHCPQCNAFIVAESFQPHRIVRDLVEQLRLDEARQEGNRAHTCPEHHNQELTLFCKKDSRLVCLVCRDGRDHVGHSFRPVEEEGEEVKREVSSALDLLTADIFEVVCYWERQRGEITTTRWTSNLLKIQISQQFEELRKELEWREVEEMRKVDEQGDLTAMEKNLAMMETCLVDARAQLANLQSLLHLSDPRDLVVQWREKGRVDESRKLSSPSGSFPRICLLQNRLALRPPLSLLPHTNWRDLEYTLARNIGSPPRSWVNPLFGNIFDYIQGLLWRWTFGKFL
ncbi:tripartite motif-containing protein 5-like [Osmerus eperlanus]|uniref:tripartite motif-containing protein 5-like n=1 Tax=Osmerus eperlanus TaxID=29151 RepID=UPI002E0DE1B2